MGVSDPAGPFCSGIRAKRRQWPEHGNIHIENLCSTGNQHHPGDRRHSRHCRRDPGLFQMEQRRSGHQQGIDGLGRFLRIPRGIRTGDKSLFRLVIWPGNSLFIRGCRSPLFSKALKESLFTGGWASCFPALFSAL